MGAYWENWKARVLKAIKQDSILKKDSKLQDEISKTGPQQGNSFIFEEIQIGSIESYERLKFLLERLENKLEPDDFQMLITFHDTQNRDVNVSANPYSTTEGIKQRNARRNYVAQNLPIACAIRKGKLPFVKLLLEKYGKNLEALFESKNRLRSFLLQQILEKKDTNAIEIEERMEVLSYLLQQEKLGNATQAEIENLVFLCADKQQEPAMLGFLVNYYKATFSNKALLNQNLCFLGIKQIVSRSSANENPKVEKQIECLRILKSIDSSIDSEAYNQEVVKSAIFHSKELALEYLKLLTKDFHFDESLIKKIFSEANVNIKIWEFLWDILNLELKIKVTVEWNAFFTKPFPYPEDGVTRFYYYLWSIAIGQKNLDIKLLFSLISNVCESLSAQNFQANFNHQNKQPFSAAYIPLALCYLRARAIINDTFSFENQDAIMAKMANAKDLIKTVSEVCHKKMVYSWQLKAPTLSLVAFLYGQAPVVNADKEFKISVVEAVVHAHFMYSFAEESKSAQTNAHGQSQQQPSIVPAQERTEKVRSILVEPELISLFEDPNRALLTDFPAAHTLRNLAITQLKLLAQHDRDNAQAQAQVPQHIREEIASPHFAPTLWACGDSSAKEKIKALISSTRQVNVQQPVDIPLTSARSSSSSAKNMSPPPSLDTLPKTGNSTNEPSTVPPVAASSQDEPADMGKRKKVKPNPTEIKATQVEAREKPDAGEPPAKRQKTSTSAVGQLERFSAAGSSSDQGTALLPKRRSLVTEKRPQ